MVALLICRVAPFVADPLCSIDPMQACIANFLLLLTLVGGFTPFLQALSGVQPHACCLRRMHATGKHTSEISSGIFGDGNCCPPLTTPQSAQVVPSEAVFALPNTAPADLSPWVSICSNLRVLGIFGPRSSCLAHISLFCGSGHASSIAPLPEPGG